ncbi:diguanylate cyclase (GGDEF)-like protein/PAS domain S-box-containing protein [Litorivivens lipolytica]|uniref:Diguanylate cyclase (GGDEF)-like protein/PAS domain S-box-containing protein n=1 Tax=Litorivivens lipolytica TaxID=1524264 RepID=A0A7W4W550_9GAMM|nr:GGDEF and EAL domain-containing protein [Litorivivens lipolytica]MBB3047633.1 diguanylate cyclase (GGDEF)-like protein/PAS domain S-box-containing protein [Litorivivens lipolytica]
MRTDRLNLSKLGATGVTTLLLPFSATAHPMITPAGLMNFAEFSLIALGLLAAVLFIQHTRMLRSRERDFRERLDALPHIVWRTDTRNELLNLSGAFGRLTGMSPASASITDWIDVIHPDDREQAYRLWGAAMKDGRPFTTDYRMRMADGSYRHFESQGVPIVDSEGEISEWVGSIIDIHERKQAELALLEKEASLRLAVEGANIGFWDWNLSTNSIRFSQQWKTQLGLTSNKFPETLEFFQYLIHPDDQEKVLALKTQIQNNPRGQFSIEYRLAHTDGEHRWMLSPATVIEDPQTRERHLIGANIDISERKAAEQRMAHQASHDELLNLPNRRELNAQLGKVIARNQEAALILIDLDDFKSTNDSMGHEVGDTLLQAVRNRLQSCLGQGDLLYRPEGDEFAVLVENYGDREALLGLGYRLLNRLAEPLNIDQQRIFITATLGISLYPEHGDQPEQLMRFADAALYRGKRSGKNCVRVFDPSITADMQEWNHLKNALKCAIENNELSVAFQPQIELRSGRVVGFEALARWLSLDLGHITPERFIPIAEAAGMIDQVSQSVVAQSLNLIQQWTEEQRKALYVAINISTHQLHDATFVSRIKQQVREAGIPCHCIELEITETSIMQDIDIALTALRELSEAGFRLAIDDFGTGYCNLSYLKQMNVERLKIDSSFVRDMNASNSDGKIVQAIIALSHSLGLEVTAEGVEHPDQVELLHAMGCEQAQGYYFAKPMPAEHVQIYLDPDMSNVTPITSRKP